MPTYRFTYQTFCEVNIEAETLEEAKELAEQDWYDAFGRGTDIYGGPEFEGIVEEDAE